MMRDELNNPTPELRFPLTITREDGLKTFEVGVWGTDRDAALARVEKIRTGDADLWDGWTFEVAETGTPYVDTAS